MLAKVCKINMPPPECLQKPTTSAVDGKDKRSDDVNIGSDGKRVGHVAVRRVLQQVVVVDQADDLANRFLQLARGDADGRERDGRGQAKPQGKRHEHAGPVPRLDAMLAQGVVAAVGLPWTAAAGAAKAGHSRSRAVGWQRPQACPATTR